MPARRSSTGPGCGTRLHLGEQAVVEVTGLRNPCAQIEAFAPGLLTAVLGKDAKGRVVGKAGIMSAVVRGGTVRPGDRIDVRLLDVPHHRLERV